MIQVLVRFKIKVFMAGLLTAFTGLSYFLSHSFELFARCGSDYLPCSVSCIKYLANDCSINYAAS